MKQSRSHAYNSGNNSLNQTLATNSKQELPKFISVQQNINSNINRSQMICNFQTITERIDGIIIESVNLEHEFNEEKKKHHQMMRKLSKAGPNLGAAVAEANGEELGHDKIVDLFSTEAAFKKVVPKTKYHDKFSRPQTGKKQRCT